MNCQSCRADCPDTANFCHVCGAGLAGARQSCPQCRAEQPSAARFCSACGSALTPSAPAAERRAFSAGGFDELQRLMPKQYIEQLLATKGHVSSERRIVTILFSDVSGSTSLGEQLDPEDVLEIMNGAFEVLIRPIYRYEGTLARLMGDAILAFFGAPIAHEDDPVRACRAGLEIVEGARAYAAKLERERGLKGFDVRVGINTGLVVVGEVGADMRVEYTAMGDVVNLAARMESTAVPGTVLVTEDTHAFIAHAFETECLSTIQVKGRVQPVATYRVKAFTSASQARDARPRRRTTLVGREPEFQRVGDGLAALQQGRGGRLAVTGETGLGKSRLLHEARQRLSADLAWAEGRALPHTQDMSHALVRSGFRNLLDAENGAVEAALTHRVEELFGARAGAVLPFLACILEVPLSREPDRLFARLEGERLHACLIQACVEFVRRSVESAPLVLAFDDVQWADPSSLRILEALALLPDTMPLFLFISLRPDEGRGWSFHQRLQQRYGDRYPVLALKPLGVADGRQLLEKRAAGTPLPERLAHAILDRADGNPFFIEELWQSVLDACLTDGAGNSKLDPNVPRTLQGVLQARLDRLGAESKRALQTASVIGRIFQDGLLGSMFDATRAEHLRDWLGDLTARDFIGPCQTSDEDEMLLGDPYAFRQAITQEVTYGSLLIAERKTLHQRIGEAIERQCPSRLDELSPVLAYHFDRAGVASKALTYLIRAARRAARVHALDEALAYYERAEARALAVDVSAADRLALNEGLADLRFRQGQYQTALDHYLAALGTGPNRLQRVALFRKLGQLYEKWGRYEEALASFHTALNEMGADLEETELARIYTGMAMTRYRQGNLDEALELGQLALVLSEGRHDEAGIAEACNNLGIIHAKRRDWTAALDHHRRGLEIWGRLGEPYSEAAAHNNVGLAYHSQGERETAIEHFRRSLELFERIGNRPGVARAADNLGRAYMECGDEERGMAYLKDAVAILGEIGMEGSELVPEMWQSGVW